MTSDQVAASASPLPEESTRWTADEALTELYRAHWRSLVRLSYLLVRDQAVAEEVVQDAFIAVHRRWRRMSDHDQALAYLRVAVVNGSRSALRRRTVRHRWTQAGGPTAAGTRSLAAVNAALAQLPSCPPGNVRYWSCGTTWGCPRARSPRPCRSAVGL